MLTTAGVLLLIGGQPAKAVAATAAAALGGAGLVRALDAWTKYEVDRAAVLAAHRAELERELEEFDELILTLYASRALARSILSRQELVVDERGPTIVRALLHHHPYLLSVHQYDNLEDWAHTGFRLGLGWHEEARDAEWLDDWLNKAIAVRDQRVVWLRDPNLRGWTPGGRRGPRDA